jgi:hypothetical protein
VEKEEKGIAHVHVILADLIHSTCMMEHGAAVVVHVQLSVNCLLR